MKNEEKRPRKIFFEFEQRYKKINTSYELQRKYDKECYDKVMGSNPNYPAIVFYTHVRKFMQRLKFSVLTILKKLRNVNNRMMIFIILL